MAKHRTRKQPRTSARSAAPPAPVIPLTLPRILRGRTVSAVTGLSLSTMWRMRRRGAFPAPVQLGLNSIGWTEDAIRTWIESRQKRAS